MTFQHLKEDEFDNYDDLEEIETYLQRKKEEFLEKKEKHIEEQKNVRIQELNEIKAKFLSGDSSLNIKNLPSLQNIYNEIIYLKKCLPIRDEITQVNGYIKDIKDNLPNEKTFPDFIELLEKANSYSEATQDYCKTALKNLEEEIFNVTKQNCIELIFKYNFAMNPTNELFIDTDFLQNYGIFKEICEFSQKSKNQVFSSIVDRFLFHFTNQKDTKDVVPSFWLDYLFNQIEILSHILPVELYGLFNDLIKAGRLRLHEDLRNKNFIAIDFALMFDYHVSQLFSREKFKVFEPISILNSLLDDKVLLEWMESSFSTFIIVDVNILFRKIEILLESILLLDDLTVLNVFEKFVVRMIENFYNHEKFKTEFELSNFRNICECFAMFEEKFHIFITKLSLYYLPSKLLDVETMFDEFVNKYFKNFLKYHKFDSLRTDQIHELIVQLNIPKRWMYKLLFVYKCV
eukprot:TRINITY_DN13972_c0_g1_i1.p1 TRINITY_DN13972_c0_g1~~TRINITY_DN13972_c0_g1_i1.p1  ORF type:complete len:460 (+),score=145.60 TRINITY_DN13972_c0_g1_i1:31-1410(+)